MPRSKTAHLHTPAVKKRAARARAKAMAERKSGRVQASVTEVAAALRGARRVRSRVIGTERLRPVPWSTISRLIIEIADTMSGIGR